MPARPSYGSHIGQLRQAIDAVRAAANLPTAWASYADATGPALASDLDVMLDKLNEARVLLEVPEIELTDSLAAGVTIRASQLQQIRGGVQ